MYFFYHCGRFFGNFGKGLLVATHSIWPFCHHYSFELCADHVVSRIGDGFFQPGTSTLLWTHQILHATCYVRPWTMDLRFLNSPPCSISTGSHSVRVRQGPSFQRCRQLRRLANSISVGRLRRRPLTGIFAFL